MAEELPFKVVRTNGHDEVLAQGIKLLIARAAYEKAAELYLRDRIELRQDTRILDKSKPDLRQTWLAGIHRRPGSSKKLIRNRLHLQL